MIDTNLFCAELEDLDERFRRKNPNMLRSEAGLDPLVPSDYILKDSGSRREFDTGAVRDIAEGKGRCDLIPLDIISCLVVNDRIRIILNQIERFKESKDIAFLEQALGMFMDYMNKNEASVILELAKHYEDGAKKYSENNWKKGIPLHCYIDSGVRHLLKVYRGDTDEPHDRAFIWNMVGAIWTITHKPELDDIESDLKIKKE